MKPGEVARIRRTFTSADRADFDLLAGGPCRHVPEPLIAALFSRLLGTHLPGAGTNYLKQELRFVDVAPLGAELVASVEITRLRPDKGLVDLWARCETANGALICEGRSLVKAAPDRF